MPDTLKLVLQYAVPLFSVFLSYILGRAQSSKKDSLSAATQRYNQFYVPYISLLYSCKLDYLNYTELSSSARAKFFDLVFHNVQFIDEDTQEHLSDFYLRTLCMEDYEDGTHPDLSAPADLDAVFKAMTRCILLEAKRLSRELHMPDIGKSFSSASSRRTKASRSEAPTGR